MALRIVPGEIVGLAGHIGAGKTTLARLAAGLLARGVAARVDGRVERPTGAIPAYVFANPWIQLTELGGTVEEEVAVGPENLGCHRSVIRQRVDRALVLAKAEHLAMRNPRELSGGELQRVALASALALDTTLLVLDEPTAQLDSEGAAAFAQVLRSLAHDGVGVLLVEQDLDLLMDVATRVVLLADGRVLAEGTTSAVLGQWPPLDARLGAPVRVEARLGGESPSLGAPLSLAASPSLAASSSLGPSAPPATPAPSLELRGLSAGYGARTIIHDLSLCVERGSAIAWTGRNGAGKTTLARTIMGLLPTRSGSIRVGGDVLDALPTERRARRVGLVFQDPGRQLFSRTVLAEAMFAPLAQGAKPSDALERARWALDTVGLHGELHSHPGDLAPQGQRRLAIAATMAAGPELLILDEPTAGQDAEGRAHIARALLAQQERGGAVVISHDLAFVRRWCSGSVTIGEPPAQELHPG